MISARWWNRKSQMSVLNRDASLTTMYGPKYLFENSRNPQAGTAQLGLFFKGLGWGWEEEWTMHSTFWLFRGLPEGLVSVSHDLQYWWGAKILRMPLSTTYFGMLLSEVAWRCSTRELSVPQTDTRGSKRLWKRNLKKKPADLCNWKISCTSSEKSHPPKKFSEIPQNL